MRSLGLAAVALLAAACALLPGAAQAKVIVSLEFDDAYSNQAGLGSTLARRGMRGTFFVNSGLIGTPGYMAPDQLLGLQSAGHEIGGHTLTHVVLPGLSPDEQRAQICDDRQRLLAMGFAISDFAYPGGETSPLTESIAASCGYDSGRNIGDIACRGCGLAESLPPFDRYATRTVYRARGWVSASQIERPVVKVERRRGVSWLQFVFHEVCDGCSPTAVRPATLGVFLDWLRSRGRRVTVLTVHEALTRYASTLTGGG